MRSTTHEDGSQDKRVGIPVFIPRLLYRCPGCIPSFFRDAVGWRSRRVGAAPNCVASGGANSYSARLYNRQAAGQSLQYRTILGEQPHGLGYGTGGCVVG